MRKPSALQFASIIANEHKLIIRHQQTQAYNTSPFNIYVCTKDLILLLNSLNGLNHTSSEIRETARFSRV